MIGGSYIAEFVIWSQFVADGVFFAELNEVLTRELAEDGYSGVEVRVTPIRTEIIIRATRTQNVLGDSLWFIEFFHRSMAYNSNLLSFGQNLEYFLFHLGKGVGNVSLKSVILFIFWSINWFFLLESSNKKLEIFEKCVILCLNIWVICCFLFFRYGHVFSFPFLY